MAYTSTLIWDGALAENQLNFSDFFQYAEFLFVKWPEKPDWSQSGDFVEIDGDLLITVEPGVKRRIDLFSYLDSRSVIAIPEEYTRSGLLCELVLQASFSVNLQIYALVPESAPVDLPTLVDQVNEILLLLTDIAPILLPAGQLFTSLPPGI